MEYYVICKACGKGFTYTTGDIQKSLSDAKGNILSAIGSASGALSGNWGASIANQQNYKELRDFNRCPHCGSTNIRQVSFEEYQKSQKQLAGGAVGVQINTNATVEALMQRIELFLETEDWDKADAYCDQVLDQEPNNAMAYVYKLLAENKLSSLESLSESTQKYTDTNNYKFAIRFADPELKEELTKCAEKSAEMTESVRLETIYQNGLSMYRLNTLEGYNSSIAEFETISDYKDANELIENARHHIDKLSVKNKEIVRKRRKTIIICSLLVVALFAAWSFVQTKANSEREKQIMDNFVGKEMSYSFHNSIADEEFHYMFYDEGKYSGTFYVKLHDSGSEDVSSGDYYVHVHLFGDITIQFDDGEELPLTVDDNDNPISFSSGDRVYY